MWKQVKFLFFGVVLLLVLHNSFGDADPFWGALAGAVGRAGAAAAAGAGKAAAGVGKAASSVGKTAVALKRQVAAKIPVAVRRIDADDTQLLIPAKRLNIQPRGLPWKDTTGGMQGHARIVAHEAEALAEVPSADVHGTGHIIAEEVEDMVGEPQSIGFDKQNEEFPQKVTSDISPGGHAASQDESLNPMHNGAQPDPDIPLENGIPKDESDPLNPVTGNGKFDERNNDIDAADSVPGTKAAGKDSINPSKAGEGEVSIISGGGADVSPRGRGVSRDESLNPIQTNGAQPHPDSQPGNVIPKNDESEPVNPVSENGEVGNHNKDNAAADSVPGIKVDEKASIIPTRDAENEGSIKPDKGAKDEGEIIENNNLVPKNMDGLEAAFPNLFFLIIIVVIVILVLFLVLVMMYLTYKFVSYFKLVKSHAQRDSTCSHNNNQNETSV